MDLYRATDIMSFLELIHPEILDPKSDTCVEIRAINRINKKDISSCNIWNNEKSFPYLEKYISKISRKTACVYYSVYSMNKKDKEKLINSNNSQATRIVVADFDNINKDKFYEYYNKLTTIGIKPIVVNSGNGYQIIILLNREIKNKTVLKRFNNVLYSKGFDVDLNIQSSAQLMRLPFSYNCKEFDINNKKYQEKPEKKSTFIEQYSTERYSLSYIFEALSNLETVRDIKKNKNELKPDILYGNEDYLSVISEQDWAGFPSAVQNMLLYCEKGFRNNALISLITYFKKQKYSQQKVATILKIWSRHTSPNMNMEFLSAEINRLYKYNFASIDRFYNYQMVERFGAFEINFDINQKEALFISNKLFSNYKNIKGSTIKLYLFMLYEFNINNNGITKDYALQKLNISHATFNRAIKQLKKEGLLRTIKSYKKECIQYIYLPVNEIQVKKYGYTVLQYQLVFDILFNEYSKLNSNEIKVYLYMHKQMNLKNRTWESQETIGEKTGLTSCSISRITTKLCIKKYINKEQIHLLINDKKLLALIERYDVHLYHFIINEIKYKYRKWKTNCMYWIHDFLAFKNLETLT